VTVYKPKRYVLYRLIKILVGPWVKKYMCYKCEKITPGSAPLLILSNHYSDLDPALVGFANKAPLRFVASEHSMRAGLPGKLLKSIFDPIIRVKSRTESAAAREILRNLKAGQDVCIFAEGDRSFNGITGPIAPGLARLIRISGARLVNFRLQGAYFSQPRWSAGFRRGPIKGVVAGDYSPEQLSEKTYEQIDELIEKDLNEDAYARQEIDNFRYKGKNLAEYIETLLYICPKCNSIGKIHSEGSRFFCDCGLKGNYDEYGRISGEGVTYKNLRDWDLWQIGQTKRLISECGDNAIFIDENIRCSTVLVCHSSEMIDSGSLAMYSDRMICGSLEFPFEDIHDLQVAGKNTIFFSDDAGKLYELRSDKPYNALKYRRVFEEVKNARYERSVRYLHKEQQATSEKTVVAGN